MKNSGFGLNNGYSLYSLDCPQTTHNIKVKV